MSELEELRADDEKRLRIRPSVMKLAEEMESILSSSAPFDYGYYPGKESTCKMFAKLHIDMAHDCKSNSKMHPHCKGEAFRSVCLASIWSLLMIDESLDKKKS